MLRKLLIYKQNKRQLFLAAIGTILGILFLLLSTHYFIRIQEYGSGSEMLQENALVIQKKVSNASLFSLSKSDFSEYEIEQIGEQDFVESVAKVINNDFRIVFETHDKSVPFFNSDVFVQSVPPNALDLRFDNWQWKEGDSLVPIVLPRDFLMMLNTFMSSSGMPQISEDIAKMLNFRFILYNPQGGRTYYQAKIVGFTNELSAILVPETFIRYGNEHFGESKEAKTTQLLILGKEKRFGALEKFLNEKQYDSKNAQVVINRLKSIFSILLSCVMFTAALGVFLSALVLIQYAQLMLYDKKYELRTLHRMGFAQRKLAGVFIKYFLTAFLLFNGISCATFVVIKASIDHYFVDGGIAINTELSSFIFLLLLVIYFLFAGMIVWSVRKNIKHFQ